MELNLKDVALQSATPMVMVPSYTELEELSEPGHRVLAAKNGFWLEVKRAWLYMRLFIALPLPIHVPYGTVCEERRFKFGKLPRTLVTQFIEEAKVRCPNECAAWAVWNQQTNAWRLQMIEETSVGVAFVKLKLPVLGDDEFMVMDIHSHGRLDAFFSEEDNMDDKGEMKIAGVIGNLDKDTVTTAFRICVDGLFIPISFNNPQG